MTMPHSQFQRLIKRMAFSFAVRRFSASFVECHGTQPVGDARPLARPLMEKGLLLWHGGMLEGVH